MDEVDLNVSEIVLRFVEGREKKGHQKRRWKLQEIGTDISSAMTLREVITLCKGKILESFASNDSGS
jgi:hypothetical protein